MQWVEPEKQVARILRPELETFLAMSRMAHGFVEAGLSTAMTGRAGPPGHAAEVQARLLVRISHDLRVVELAAARSYVLQALSQCASIYEIAHAVAFIGGDESRARAWESHADSHQSYPSARDRRNAVRATLEALVPGIPSLDQAVKTQEELYEAFCVAKHGNPKALRRFGMIVKGDTATIYHGPFMTEYVVRQGRVALLHATRLVVGATVVFARRMLPGVQPKARRRYVQRELRIMTKLRELMALDPTRVRPPSKRMDATSARSG